MHILHISNSYGGTKVYENLYTQLDKLGVRQTVFVPLNAANHSRGGKSDDRLPDGRLKDYILNGIETQTQNLLYVED